MLAYLNSARDFWTEKEELTQPVQFAHEATKWFRQADLIEFEGD